MPSHQTGAPKTDLSAELFHSLDPSCPVTTIDCSGSLDAPSEEGEIRNLRQVGGYRWLYRRYPQQPEISVPGVPDLWDPPKLPEKIGKVGRDCDLQGYMEVVDGEFRSQPSSGYTVMCMAIRKSHLQPCLGVESTADSRSQCYTTQTARHIPL